IHSREDWKESLGAIASIALIFILFVMAPSSWSRYGETVRTGGEYKDSISTYIHNNTNPVDLVLTWYPEMGINFMARRTSPVKYLYYPLFLDDSLTEEIENTYIENIKSTPPTLIVDCSRSVDAIPSLDPVTREEQYSTTGVKRKMLIHPGMDEIFAFVEQNYHIETTVEGCIIFRFNN
ncbi:MAG: hypothetical protein WAU24_14315, partial [Chitinophagaceae bacterium]